MGTTMRDRPDRRQDQQTSALGVQRSTHAFCPPLLSQSIHQEANKSEAPRIQNSAFMGHRWCLNTLYHSAGLYAAVLMSRSYIYIYVIYISVYMSFIYIYNISFETESNVFYI